MGNCYFLSALSAIAEFPKRIADLFLTKEANKAGCYAMRFIVNGEYKEVIVDDYFPYDPKLKGPAFSRAKGNELWVLLLEKAWAKLNGNYENTISGLVHDALAFLLPAPCEFLDHNYEEDIWP